jgi:hypothetical protein
MAFEELPGRSAAVVGLEQDLRDDAAALVDLADRQALDLEGGVAGGRVPADAFQRQAIAGRGEHCTRVQSVPGMTTAGEEGLAIPGEADPAPAVVEEQARRIQVRERVPVACLARLLLAIARARRRVRRDAQRIGAQLREARERGVECLDLEELEPRDAAARDGRRADEPVLPGTSFGEGSERPRHGDHAVALEGEHEPQLEVDVGREIPQHREGVQIRRCSRPCGRRRPREREWRGGLRKRCRSAARVAPARGSGRTPEGRGSTRRRRRSGLPPDSQRRKRSTASGTRSSRVPYV